MRHFGAVVRINMVDVTHRRHDRPMSGIIASEFIGDQTPGFAPLTFEEATEKPFRCPLIATVFHQAINRHRRLGPRPAADTAVALEG